MLRALACALAIAALAIFAAPAARAQTTADNKLSLAAFPAAPGPEETVTFTVESYSVNIQAASIRWTVDGRTALEGVGRTSLQVTAKKLGQRTVVTVTVLPQGAAALTKSASITPASADVLWQAADSAVPPFYRGKAMPLAESKISFVAVPQVGSSSGALLAPGSLLYSWSENYDADQASSGYGRSSYESDMDYLNPGKGVSVSVSDRSGAVLARGSASVFPREPKLLWYAASPLYGPMYEKALSGSYDVTTSDIALLAQPFFSSLKNNFLWTLNGDELGPQSVVNVLPLHRDTAEAGTATVSVETRSAAKLFQDARATLTLKLQ